MGWLEGVADEVGSLERLIRALLNLDAVVGDALWRRRARRILAHMRGLYFQESGTLGFLRRTAAGEAPSAETVERLREGFFRTDERVEAAIAEMRRLADLHDVRLSLEDWTTLDGMLHDKTNIREAVRSILDEAVEDGTSEALRADAAALVARIEALNAVFREADARLRAV
jgi:hypothetical protein